MARRRAAGALVALLAGAAASGMDAAAAEERLRTRLEVELQWAVGLHGGSTQKAELVASPELVLDVSEEWKLVLRGRIRADPFDRLAPGREAAHGGAFLSEPFEPVSGAELELRELYLEGSVGRVLLSLGKQQVVWGRSDGLKLLDAVDPQDFREFILDEFEDSRIPLWTLAAELPLGGAVLQALWIPDPSVHALPAAGAPFAFTAPRFRPPLAPGVQPRWQRAETPERAVADSDAGLRLSSSWRGVDFSLNYLWRHDDAPVYRVEPAPDAAGLADVRPVHRRHHLVGGSATRALGSFTLRAELALLLGRAMNSDDPGAGHGLVEADDLSAVVGLDWYGLEDTLLSLQLFQSRVPRAPRGLLRPAAETRVTFLARRELRRDTLTAELLVLHDLRGGDGLVRPRLRFSPRDDVVLSLGLDLFYGAADGVFGEFDRNDRVVLGVEWTL